MTHAGGVKPIPIRPPPHESGRITHTLRPLQAGRTEFWDPDTGRPFARTWQETPRCTSRRGSSSPPRSGARAALERATSRRIGRDLGRWLLADRTCKKSRRRRSSTVSRVGVASRRPRRGRGRRGSSSRGRCPGLGGNDLLAQGWAPTSPGPGPAPLIVRTNTRIGSPSGTSRPPSIPSSDLTP